MIKIDLNKFKKGMEIILDASFQRVTVETLYKKLFIENTEINNLIIQELESMKDIPEDLIVNYKKLVDFLSNCKKFNFDLKFNNIKIKNIIKKDISTFVENNFNLDINNIEIKYAICENTKIDLPMNTLLVDLEKGDNYVFTNIN